MSKRVVVSLFVVVAAAAAAVAIGCGGNGEDTPEEVTETFFNAVADGDGEEACDLLSDEGLENLPQDPEACEEEVAELSEEERAAIEVEGVEQVTGDTENCGTIEESETEAEVEVTFPDDVECVNLSKIDDEWKINDV
jgi:Domain of unknown function (DUF4878)